MEDQRMLKLRKIGGSWQPAIEDAADLEALPALNEALWAAMSTPTDILTCDTKFLDYLDTDENNHIRTDELLDGIKWMLGLLADRSDVAKGTDTLRLDAINSQSEDGVSLRATAETVLANLGAEDKSVIKLEHVRDRQKILASGAANGDGIIPPEAADDEPLSAFITDVIKTVGAVDDASGVKGVGYEQLDKFLSEAEAHIAWLDKGKVAKNEKNETMPFGADTGESFAAYSAIKGKLEQFFALCAIAKIDESIAAPVSFSGISVGMEGWNDSTALTEKLREAPLATPDKYERIRFDESINPAWREEVDRFIETVLKKRKGKRHSELTREDWEEIKSLFKAHEDWLANKAGKTVEKLGGDKLQNHLSGNLPSRLREMIENDKSIANEMDRVKDVEKLILYQRWLFELANNMASFPALYDPDRDSIVDVGALLMDGRRFTLNIKVTDRKSNMAIAKESRICLLYSEVYGSKSDNKFEIVTPVTSGSMEKLFKGKQGVFFTTDGKEWNTRVVDIIENPVSLWEAVKQPFKKLAEFLGKQAERFSTSRYDSMEKSVDSAIKEADKSMQVNTVPGKPLKNNTQSGALRDILMGGSVAIAALGGSMAYITQTISKVQFWQILAVALGLLAIIAVPTLIAAWIKLRRRNLSILLEACGLAMNTDMRLTSGIGRLFTRVPPYPPKTRKLHKDLAKEYLKKLPEAARRRAHLALAVILGLLIGSSSGLGIWYIQNLRTHSKINQSNKENAKSALSSTKHDLEELQSQNAKLRETINRLKSTSKADNNPPESTEKNSTDNVNKPEGNTINSNLNNNIKANRTPH